VSAKALGKGFEVLIPVGLDIDDVVGANEKIHKLAIDVIKPKDNQPRKRFDETSLNELAQSIKEHGILQPIIVTKLELNLYSIIAGERRYRAAIIAGLSEVPAIVRSATEHEQLEIALLENVQRADLTPLEQALTLHRLHTQFSQSYEDISRRLGKAQTTIVNNIRLLGLPLAMQESLQAGNITEGHARTLLSLQKYPKEQQHLFSEILAKGLNVRQAEQYVVAVKKGQVSSDTKGQTTVKANEIADKIKDYLKAKNVYVQQSKKGSGKLVITYKTEAEFESIVKTILRH
jgi:ParB family transcriptional regulator, chromosome partitioning protein